MRTTTHVRMANPVNILDTLDIVMFDVFKNVLRVSAYVTYKDRKGGHCINGLIQKMTQ